MKKKLLVLVLVVAAVGASLYFYIYKGHRDVATTAADYTVTIADLSIEFATNDSLATLKYQDKVLELSGTITAVEASSKSIVIDEKVFAVFDVAIPSEVKNKNKVTIKGRFLGYDELLEEFKIDQVSLIE